ncbi:PREDICTED: uncharacterized protein LOC109149029 isoform X1 [Ipomoea nil]|uniref:uncharacterized protein LOC109149029 isoform X1 n=1 Tax=Ipomoea nil TaxID=35883 RepID=UPI000900D3EF|nr:PREDICTED: uncharacterized protein LOC109149029 isoform X1 [Ipomoea nil]
MSQEKGPMASKPPESNSVSHSLGDNLDAQPPSDYLDDAEVGRRMEDGHRESIQYVRSHHQASEREVKAKIEKSAKEGNSSSIANEGNTEIASGSEIPTVGDGKAQGKGLKSSGDPSTSKMKESENLGAKQVAGKPNPLPVRENASKARGNFNPEVEAYRRALKTWASWIDEHLKQKKLVFYRGYSSAHFRNPNVFKLQRIIIIHHQKRREEERTQMQVQMQAQIASLMEELRRNGMLSNPSTQAQHSANSNDETLGDDLIMFINIFGTVLMM